MTMLTCGVMSSLGFTRRAGCKKARLQGLLRDTVQRVARSIPFVGGPARRALLARFRGAAPTLHLQPSVRSPDRRPPRAGSLTSRALWLVTAKTLAFAFSFMLPLLLVRR